jgi:hypothetical protein
MKFKTIACLVLLGMSVNLLWVRDAHAYLDPGAGSALLQGLLAAVAAIAVVAKLYWHRLLRFFGFRKLMTNIEQTTTQDDQKKSKDNKSA